jgi:hypothetical protein
MYLGDGHLVRYPRAYALRIFLNEKRQDIIDRVKTAIAILLPDNRVSQASRRGAAVVIVTCYSQDWPMLFPQHGPGRKHTRPMALEPWQRLVVDRYPADFLRGCLESDGCRHRRIVKGKDYLHTLSPTTPRTSSACSLQPAIGSGCGGAGPIA